MSNRDFSRRSFLRSTGLSAGLLPLLASDRPSWAAGSAPKRLILMTWPNGVRAEHWYPDCLKGKWDYSVDPASDATETNFTLQGRRMIEPLEPWKQQLLLINGLRLRCFDDLPKNGGGHESLPSLYTGRTPVLPTPTSKQQGGGASVDQFIAEEISKKDPTPFKSLTLAAQGKDNRGLIWKAAEQRVTPEQDPYKLYDTLFAGRTFDPAAFERQRAARRSILDFVKGELGNFGKKLGKDDRSKVDFHLQSVREIERRLGGASPPAGGAAPASLPAMKFDAKNTAFFDRVTRSLTDLTVAALASDLTRVVSLQLCDGDAFSLVMPFLGPEYVAAATGGGLGNDNGHHPHAHAGDEKHVVQQRWFAEQFAYLLEKLKGTTDAGGGSLLDNTLVCVMNNMTTGGGHGTSLMPTFLAGNCGGYFKTGRYLKYTPSLPTNALLTSLCHAMDVPVDTFGDPKYGTGELPRLRG